MASTHTLQDTPGAFLQNSTRRIRILFKRVKYCIIMQDKGQGGEEFTILLFLAHNIILQEISRKLTLQAVP